MTPVLHRHFREGPFYLKRQPEIDLIFNPKENTTC
jgi:hypothetical protein